MVLTTILFYLFSVMICLSALAVVFNPSPVYAALSLVITMVGLSFLFFLLEAYFIAGVQLVVYAGAVMVLFVMVLMLFNLKKEKAILSELSFFKKAAAVVISGLFGGLLLGSVFKVSHLASLFTVGGGVKQAGEGTKELSQLLFTQYVFAFEVLGLMLLLIAVGVVAVSRAKGGTHAES